MGLEEAIKNFEQEIGEFEGLEKIHAVTYEDYERIEKTRQLLEWLKELLRARVLLKATHELLEKADDSPYVLNALEIIVNYDGAECDGQCLKEDIEYHFDEFCWEGE